MNKSVKSFVRWLYFRNRLFRRVISGVSVLIGRSQPVDVSHLSFYRGNSRGAAPQDEALFLFTITKLTLPSVIVEFGFLSGHTAFNFIQAAQPDMHIYSYDVSEESLVKATTELNCLPNLTFFPKSQTDFDPADINHQLIDLVFIDASHVFSLNQVTWKKILPSLAPTALIVIHDTGTWSRDHMADHQQDFAKSRPELWLNPNEFQFEKEEREFVNWLQAEYPEFGAVHFHTLKKLRNGFTVLQRKMVLPT